MKIGGLAVPYGPSKYHAEIEHGALKGSNGKKVPQLIKKELANLK